MDSFWQLVIIVTAADTVWQEELVELIGSGLTAHGKTIFKGEEVEMASLRQKKMRRFSYIEKYRHMSGGYNVLHWL